MQLVELLREGTDTTCALSSLNLHNEHPTQVTVWKAQTFATQDLRHLLQPDAAQAV